MNQDSIWEKCEDGLFRRKTIHRMSRRCVNWNYCGTGVYMITLELNDRSSRAFGRVVGPLGEMVVSEIGFVVLEQVKLISKFTPEIEILGSQIMPDHLHIVLHVKRHMAKSLGERLRGFKIGCTKAVREFCGINTTEQSKRGEGLFADGFVDTILFDDKAIENAINYLKDNPRRLFEKSSHPELFRVLRDLSIPITLGDKKGFGHFAAIGNHNLLSFPSLSQVQCSRRDFAYQYDEKGALLKDETPAISTSTFDEKVTELLAAAKHGAVLVSPCISHGEKEIANRAFTAGYKVITLQNKGFSNLYKPGGKLFNTCASGNLLMLSPIAWPYLPGHKPITRVDACVLNHIAQLICGTGAADINYRGIQPRDVESLTVNAVKFEEI